MAKYYGKVGFVFPETEERPGIWKAKIEERPYYGDVENLSWKLVANNTTPNNDLSVNKVISILANQYAYEHIDLIKYVEYVGALWSITSIDPVFPRLRLTLGGIYNGPTPDAS